MSYNISLSGHASDESAIIEVFKETVRSLRAADPAYSHTVGGSISSSSGSLFASNVVDEIEVVEDSDDDVITDGVELEEGEG